MDQPNHQNQRPVPLKKRVLSPHTLISFAIAAALVLFLATRLDLDWEMTLQNIRRMDPWLYAVALGAYYLSFIFRGMRWRVLARNADGDGASVIRLPSWITSSQIILSAWFVNSITWLRLGDAYRAYDFSEESGGSFSWSLGTVLAERVMDMAIIFLVLVFSVALLTLTSGLLGSGYLLAAASLMALGLLAVMFFMRLYGFRIAQYLPRKLEEAYQRFHQGALGGFKQIPTLALLGLTAWVMEISRLYFIIQALGLEVSWPFIPIVALGHAILSTVPTPGGIGAVEPGVTGLLLLSFDQNDAVSIALVDRSITYASIIAVGGLVFLLRRVMRARQEKAATKSLASVAPEDNAAD